MSTINDLISKRKQDAKKREPKRDISYGTTIAKDYDDSPQVANRKGFVWIMEKGNNHAFQCYNASVPLAVGMPVRIMRDANVPSRRVVQGVDYDALGVTLDSPDPGKSLSVPNHHRNHEFLTMFPGLDVVNVYSRSIVPLKIYPGSTALTICVMPGDYEVDQTHVYYPGLVDDDISGQIPTTAGNYVSCLVFLDSATNVVGYLNGTEGVGMYPTEPAVPDGDIPLGYVRLHNGMTGLLTETEITNDPRPFISIATGGGGAGTGDVIQDGAITVGHLAIFSADKHIEDGGVVPAGGGTYKNIWSPMAPPTSPATEDDEFPVGSLDVKWSTWDVDSIITSLTIDDRGLVIVPSVATLNKVGGIYQTAPATPFTIWTQVSVVYKEYVEMGLLLGEDFVANPSTCRAYTHDYMGLTTWGLGFLANLWNNYGSRNHDVFYDGGHYLLNHLWLRIRVTSTNIYFDFSEDGVGWFQIGTEAIAFTPAQIGLFAYSQGGTYAPVCMYKFFRVTASADFNQVMLGNKIQLLMA